MRLTILAATAETTTLPKTATCSSLSSTSMAKTTPAMGALKVAAIPAAAPQATRFLMRSSERCSHWPIDEPSAEPTWTMGPSRPAEPPVPIQRAEATILARATRGRMRPPRRMRACITSGTPCPLASKANFAMIGPTRRPPMTGIRISQKRPKAGNIFSAPT